MTTEEIAKKLVAHCQNGTEFECLNELYAENAVSIEPMGMGDRGPVSKGKAAIRGKHEWWDATFEVHEQGIEGPFVNGDSFCVVFEVDCSERSSGQRWKAKETALYEVAEGKIVKERFYMLPMS